MPSRTAVIGADIGGTKITCGAVEVGREDFRARVVISHDIATPREPPAAFYDTVADALRRILDEAQREGLRVLPPVAVAQPGRFLPDGALAPGTTPNLGTAPGQFDGVRPAQELERRLCVPVIAENDAVAQMRFGLDLLLADPAVRSDLLGETVVYLGPGTGLGGGVARVSRDGEVTTITDGHLFDMQLPGYGDGTLTAEEVFTGGAIARDVAESNSRCSIPIQPARAGTLDRLLTSCEGLAVPAGRQAEPRAEAARIADRYGEILALLIQAIHAGRMTKVRLETLRDGRLIRHVDEPDRAWSAADRAAVRGVRRFVFGGFVGCSRGLGGRIRTRALEVLRQRGPADVHIFQIPTASAQAGLLRAVLSATARLPVGMAAWRQARRARRLKKSRRAGPRAREVIVS